MKSEAAKQRLDDAIAGYVRATGDEGAILTGWVLSGSVQHPSVPGSDGYFTDNSPGLPYHSQLGLLMTSIQEKKNTVLVNTFMKEEK